MFGLPLLATVAFHGLGLAPRAAVSYVIPSKPPEHTRTLTAGDSGLDVLHLNERLYTLHFLPAQEGSDYSAATVDGVIAFQKYEGLGRDGVDGPKTHQALLQAQPPRPLASGASKRVEVSISRQVGIEILHGQVVWIFPVSTARPGYATPLGRYHIFSKFLESWSQPFSEWMPWASYFSSGYAIHGLSQVPVYPWSHGCVRVPLEFAPIVYQFDTIGTEVDIVP
jgi:hypothetical protein